MGCAISFKTREKKTESFEYVFTLFPVLRKRKNQLAGSLSGGEQQMLAIGRGLMSCPKLLLLDEPSLGLSPLIVKEVFHMVTEINSEGVTILLVEQNALKSLAISQQGYILENGSIALQGVGKDLLKDDRVRKAYLGL
jgi:branched-chain amino acid transport system ATP-binding protein